MGNIHPTAVVDPGAKVGKSTKVWHWTHIENGAIVGENCSIGQNVYIAKTAIIGNGVKIQNNVSVYDVVTVEDDAFLGPSMVFTNVINPRSFIERKHEYKPTLVKRGASIGANATIVCGNTIGKYAFVGAGSVVTSNIPDYALVYGNPARVRGWVCVCGCKLPFVASTECFGCVCGSCKREYHRTTWYNYELVVLVHDINENVSRETLPMCKK